MIIIVTNVLCLPKLGSARNVMIVCFGQVMTGLVIDHFGLFGSPIAPMTLRRAAGAVIVLIGVALVNEIRKSSADNGPNGGVTLYIMLALIDGFACAAQVAINGSLKSCVGTAAKATLISMMVGLTTTLIVMGLITAVRGRGGIFDGGIRRHWFRRLKPWMIMGGLMSIVVVGGNAVIAPLIGTGISTVMNLVGMMGSALLIDAIGFLGIEKKPVTISKITGMLLMIAGTAVISL
jgi:transporter family-2 protein